MWKSLFLRYFVGAEKNRWLTAHSFDQYALIVYRRMLDFFLWSQSSCAAPLHPQNFISVHLFIGVVNDSQKSKLNHFISQELNREKTMKEVSVLDVGGKPQRIIPERVHAVRYRLKTWCHRWKSKLRGLCSRHFTNVFIVIIIKARYHYANLTTQTIEIPWILFLS